MTIKKLLKYKYEGTKDLPKLEAIVQELSEDIKQKTLKKRMRNKVSGRETESETER